MTSITWYPRIDQAVAARFNDDRHRRGLAVFTPIKLTFMVSLILSAPVIPIRCGHLSPQRCISMNVAWWAAAGFQLSAVLYRHGVRLLWVFPLAFGFLANTAPEGVQVSPTSPAI